MNEIIALPWHDPIYRVMRFKGGGVFQFSQVSIADFLNKFYGGKEIDFEFSILVRDLITGELYNTSIHEYIDDIKTFELTSDGIKMVLNGDDTELSLLINRGIVDAMGESNGGIELLSTRDYESSIIFSNFFIDRGGWIVRPHGLCIVPEELDELPDHVIYCSPKGHIRKVGDIA